MCVKSASLTDSFILWKVNLTFLLVLSRVSKVCERFVQKGRYRRYRAIVISTACGLPVANLFPITDFPFFALHNVSA